MALPRRIALATRNEHKLIEITRICADWPVQWVTIRDPNRFPDVEETGETYLDNAALKTRAVADALGIPAIADDSGIEVDASGGFGYDPIFLPVGWDRTMAELAPDEKDRISHRGRAFRALRALLLDG